MKVRLKCATSTGITVEGVKNSFLEASRSTCEHILRSAPIESVNNTLHAGHSKVSMRGLSFHLSNIWCVTVVHNLLRIVYQKTQMWIDWLLRILGPSKVKVLYKNMYNHSISCRLLVQWPERSLNCVFLFVSNIAHR